MGFLKLIGAVSMAEHKSKVHTLEEIMSNMDDDFGKLEAERDELADKFKLAISDLAARSDQMKELAAGIASRDDEIAALRPDAEAMRKKRRDDVARVQAKRGAAKGATK